MKTALVCIAKNEENYIEEWFDYHSLLGFSNIFIYQNDWRTNLERPKLIKRITDGPLAQKIAYNSFVREFSYEFDWAAFYDVDEFLVLKKHTNISNFLIDYQDCECICVNWVFFGNNNLNKVESNNYSVLNRFTKRGRDDIKDVWHKQYKSIVNLHLCRVKNKRVAMHHPHFPISLGKDPIKKVDLFKKEIHSAENHNKFDRSIAQLNHYFCKTKPEFIEKIARGRADCTNPRKACEFNRHNLNHKEDTFILEYIKKFKKFRYKEWI